ncbi:hypothetical protein PISMIDRAFT_684534, partial [Pisolithus microcarpus 441]
MCGSSTSSVGSNRISAIVLLSATSRTLYPTGEGDVSGNLEIDGVDTRMQSIRHL